MFTECLKPENVQIIQSVSDWKEAIKVAVLPLVEQGYVTMDYIKGIIDNTEFYGAYYVITEYIALLHARAEQGVIKTQFAVTLVKDPVYFLDNKKPANLLITLAAANSTDHLEALQAFARIFESEEEIEKLLVIDDATELYETLVNATKDA